MTNRSIALLRIVLVTALLAGCASNRGTPDAAASIPSGRSPLSGTWYGSAYEVGGSSSGRNSAFYSADYSLRINDDGTWTLTARPRGGATVEDSGTLAARGNRVILSEANGRRSISLTQSGSRLYGLAKMSSERRTVMLEFTRGDGLETR